MSTSMRLTSRPFVTSIAVSGSPASSATSVDFSVTFSESVTGVGTADFSVDKSSLVSGSVTGISGSGASYTVTLSSVSGDGTLSIDLNSSGTGIEGTLGKAITSGFTAGLVHSVGHAFDVSKAVYAGDSERLDVSSQDAGPTSLAFNSDGTKVFVVGANGTEINEYALSTAFDVSTAVYSGDGERFVFAQEASARSLAFSNDGTVMFIMGFDGDDINEYALGTAFDVSTAGYSGDGERFDVFPQESVPVSLIFSNDGTKMFVMGFDGDDINEYSLGTAFDVSTAVYSGDGERFSVASEEATPFSMAFNSDGTKMYVMGTSGKDINEYALGTAFDVSTAAYAGDSERFSISSEDSAALSMTFSSDSTKLFVLGNTDMDINEYTLINPAPFISSIAVSGSPAANATSVDFAVTFSENVTGVGVADFSVDKSSLVSGSVSGISGSNASYTVTVSSVSGDGTLSIDLNSSGTGITDGENKEVSGSFTTGAVHSVGDAFDVSKAVYAGDGERFSVAGQDTNPRSLAFNNDDTKMFVLGDAGDNVNEYALGTAFDVSTAVYAGDGERFSVASQETQPFSLAFSSDGSKMYVTGFSGGDINEYALGTAFDVSTSVYAGDPERFDVSGQETFPTSLAFSNDGTKMFVLGLFGDVVNEYALGTAFDVSTAVYAGNGERFAVGVQESDPTSLSFNKDGTKMYVIGLAGDDINEYALGTAFDVSTAVYAGDGERFSVNSQEGQPNSLAFSNDGTKMFVIGADGDDINEYTLFNFAPSVSSIVVNGSPAATAVSVDFDVTFSESVTGVGTNDFSVDNSSLVSGSITGISGNGASYTVTVSSITGDGILSIDLNSSGTGIIDGENKEVSGGFTAGAVHYVGQAFDVSAAVYAGDSERFSVATQHTSPTSLAFNGDGTKMFITGTVSKEVSEYTLSTAFDVSTAVYAGDPESISIVAQVPNPASLAFNNNGSRLFVLGFGDDNINEYDLGTEYDVSTAVYSGDGERFSVGAQETQPFSLAFNQDGSKMYVVGFDGADINEYALGTVYDVSTAVYAGDGERFSVLFQEVNPITLAFNSDGTQMYVMGQGFDDISEYALGTAYDVSTAVYAGNGESFSIVAQENSPTSLAFNNDGTKMFVLGTQGKDINEYSLLTNATPTATAPTAPVVAEDDTDVALADDIQIADADAGDTQTVTFTVTGGTVTLGATGITFGGGGNGSAGFTASGTLSAINTALDAATFTPTADLNGVNAGTVLFKTNDGTIDSNNATVTFDISAVNDAPVITIPIDQSVTEDGSLTLSAANGNAITIADIDLAAGDLQVTLTATGTLTLAGTAGLVFTQGDGTEDGIMVFTGTLASVNAALDGLILVVAANQVTGIQIQIEVSDQGGAGSGGALTDTETIPVAVFTVNDAPSFTAGVDVSVEEDSGTSTTSAWATGISAGPADESDQTLTFNVSNDNTDLFSAQPSVDGATGDLSFTPAENANGVAVVTVSVTDDGAINLTSPDQTFTITVNGVNDAPELSVPSGQSVDEDGGLTFSAANGNAITLTDVDAGASEMSVAMAASSTLDLGTTTGLTITSGADGSSEIAFTGTLAEINAALDGLTYSPSLNQTSGASLSISVSDEGNTGSGGELSDSKTITITIEAVNDAPVAGDDAATTFTNTLVTINVLVNDTDQEGDALEVTAVSVPANGTATLNGDGTIDYMPDSSFEGTDTFTTTISDGNGGTDTSTTTITVNGPGPDGDGVPDATEDGAPNGGDGDNNGVLDSEENNVTSVPIAAGDNVGDYVTVVSDPSTELTQVVSADLPSPETAPDGVGIIGSLSFNVVNLTVGQATVVTLILPRGVVAISYYKFGPTAADPADHWYEFLFDGTVGAIIFPETVSDPPMIELHLTDGLLGDADLTANGVIDDPGAPIFTSNVLPVATADAATLDEDTSVTIGVLTNDEDADGDSLSLVAVAQPESGVAALNNDGTISYTPNSDFFGEDTFTYIVTDGNGAPVTGTVTVTVAPVQDPPTAVADVATTDEETPVTIAIFANDFDVDGDDIFLVAVAKPQNGETVYNSDRELTYTPDTDFSGQEVFSYSISDTAGNIVQGAITVTVTGTNDAPVAVADSATLDEDETLAIDVLSNDVDAEGDDLSIESFTQPAHGSVAASEDGTLTYSPDANYNGGDTFAYTITDGQVTSATTVTITVSPVNDAPEFEDGNVISAPAEGWVLTEVPYEVSFIEATDVDDTTLTYRWELSGTETFAVIVLMVEPNGLDVSIAAADLITALEPEGLLPGTQLTVYQRMREEDADGAEDTSAAQAVTFARNVNVAIDEELGIPTEFYLSGNYPNPFNPSTTIEFGLPQASHVMIALYDITGREVLFVTDGMLAAGVHRERVDLADLPSGVYLYRMVAGSEVFTKVLHLVK